MKWTLLMAGSIVVAGASGVRADVAKIFSDHMVLQRGVRLPIWGTVRGTGGGGTGGGGGGGDRGGERVRVSFAGQRVETTADAQGHWRVELAPLAASATPGDLVVEEGDEAGGPGGAGRVGGVGGGQTLKDLLVGDVWFCSGQSNMEYSLGKDKDAAEELPRANEPGIRLCRVGNRATLEPLADRDATWTACTPETAKGFSAVGYYLAKNLHEAEGVPIGVMSVAVSGTPAQLWTGLPVLKSDPAFAPYLATYDRLMGQAATRPARDAGAAIPGLPGSLYNGMIAPFAGMAIKGFAWYQGESNTDDAVIYRRIFPAMITEWRAAWHQPELPFVWVQLPGNGRRTPEPAPSKWAMLREAQAMTLELPATGMAVTIDLSLPRTILHPANKREVGRRLAVEARRAAYGEKIAPTPMFESFSVEGSTVRIKFKQVEGGLVAGALHPLDPAEPAVDAAGKVKGFAIAGADKKFVYADARIEGDTVVVMSSEVPAPVAVRYGWGDNPEVNLYDHESRPVAPFRTDQWEQ